MPLSPHIVKDNCHVKHERLYCLLKIDFTPEDRDMIPFSMDTHTHTYKLAAERGFHLAYGGQMVEGKKNTNCHLAVGSGVYQCVCA